MTSHVISRNCTQHHEIFFIKLVLDRTTRQHMTPHAKATDSTQPDATAIYTNHKVFKLHCTAQKYTGFDTIRLEFNAHHCTLVRRS
jgi:hypothetical protein